MLLRANFSFLLSTLMREFLTTRCEDVFWGAMTESAEPQTWPKAISSLAECRNSARGGLEAASCEAPLAPISESGGSSAVSARMVRDGSAARSGRECASLRRSALVAPPQPEAWHGASWGSWQTRSHRPSCLLGFWRHRGS